MLPHSSLTHPLNSAINALLGHRSGAVFPPIITQNTTDRPQQSQHVQSLITVNVITAVREVGAAPVAWSKTIVETDPHMPRGPISVTTLTQTVYLTRLCDPRQSEPQCSGPLICRWTQPPHPRVMQAV